MTDMIIKNLNDENKKCVEKATNAQNALKQVERELHEAKKLVHELEIKRMIKDDQVYVEDKQNEVDL